MRQAKKTALRDGISEDLSRLKAEFDQWRATRTVGKRIPAQLWAVAVELAAGHGVHHVADVLQLDVGALERRTALTGSAQQPLAPQPSAPQFVEMFVPTPMPPPARAIEPARAECVVELVNVRGTKMRVELSGAGVASLPALCNAFCAAG